MCGASAACACRAVVMLGGWCAGQGEGPASGGRSLAGVSRLVEQELEEVGLLCRGWGGCMLHVFVGVVCEVFGCLGNRRPLHVCCRGLGVVRVDA